MNERSDFTRRLKSTRRLRRKNKVALARDSAEVLVKDYPEEALAWLQLGISNTNIAKYTEAQRALDKVIRLAPKDRLHIPYYWKGHAYRQQGKLNLAVKWFRRTISQAPKNPDTHAFLAATLARMGQYQEAKAEWRKMIRLSENVDDPVTEEGHYNLGLIYRAERKYKKALEHTEKALEIDPKYRVAKTLRSDLIDAINSDT